MINHYVTGPVTRAFSHDVTGSMLVLQSSPLGVDFFSYANEFFCSSQFADAGHVSENSLYVTTGS